MRAASVAARLPAMNEAGASPARWPALLRVFALACLGLLMSVGLLPRARAQDVQAVPALSGRVIDQTGSTLTAAQVSGLASSIDVPVYVIVVVSPLDRDGDRPLDSLGVDSMVRGQLGNLARWTGGDIYVSLGPQQAARTAREIVTELRQQYLIAFEPDSLPGWHPIEVRTTNNDLVVRARSGYFVRN